jgi:hypothetical protein
MAKTVNLTVKVDDTDFKKFIQDFNNFVSQIGALNKNFQQVNTTIAKSQQSAKGVLDTIKSAISSASTLFNWTTKIGKAFIRWGTAIGGIVSMLTTGAGMFGIDRLAESILQKRRQAMGLGTTRGGLLATQIGGVGFFNDPTGVLTGIRTAMGGGPGAGALAGFGVYPGAQFGQDPYKAIGPIVKRLHQELRASTPGTEVAVGRAFTTQQGLAGWSDEDFVRLRQYTRAEVDEQLRRMEAIRKATDMEREAQKKWFDLEITFRKAKAALESAFGDRFQELTKPLQALSDAFVHLVTALLKSKTVSDLIEWLTKQLNKLTGDLEKDPDALTKLLRKWKQDFEKDWLPLLERLRVALEGFAAILEALFGSKKPEEKGGWGDPLNWGSTVHDWLKRHGVPLPGPTADQTLQGGPGSGPSTRQQPQQQPGTSNQQTPPAIQLPETTVRPKIGTQQQGGGTTFTPETNKPPWQKQSNLFMPGGNLTQFAGGPVFEGAGGTAIGMRGGNVGSVTASSRSGTGFAFGGSRGGDIITGDRTGGDSSFLRASIRGGNRIAMFGGAARDRVPGSEMNQFMGVRGGNISVAAADNRKFSRFAGPLDTDQWQMNRTPSLTIRNVPGSNLFAQSSGFA